MKYNFWIFLLIGSINTSCTQALLDIDKLTAVKLDMMKQYIDVNDAEYYGERLPTFSESQTSSLIKCKINSNPLMYHYAYESLPPLEIRKSYANGEYITYLNAKISIDSILRNNVNRVVSAGITETFLVCTGDFYHFSFNEQQYILIRMVQREYSRNGEIHVWLLLKVNEQKLLDCYAFWDGPELEPDTWGDFNGDGTLDYLDWRSLTSHISIFSLIGNKFRKDNDHYLVVRPSKSQQEYWNKYGETLERYECLDTKASKWFYPLK